MISVDALLDEIEKIAATRSAVRDVAAGVDPFGSITFGYGMADANISDAEARKRRALSTVGGAAGGAVAVPAGISGTIGAMKGLGQGGLRGAARGFAQGATAPFRKLYHAARSSRALQQVQQGKEMSAGGARSLGRFAETVTGRTISPEAAQQVVSHAPRPLVQKLHGKTKEEVGKGVRTLGLSGALSGGAAYLQYGKGRETGKLMTPEARAKATGGTLAGGAT